MEENGRIMVKDVRKRDVKENEKLMRKEMLVSLNTLALEASDSES